MDYATQIIECVKQALDISAEEIEQMIETPPDREMGDMAIVCFRLAKVMRKNPQIIANELVEKINWPSFVSKVETKGAYINLFFDKLNRAEQVVKTVLDNEKTYGSSEIGKGKMICIDYSSINIAKPFHIGHLSSTAIGNSLYRVHSYLGYKCVGINHLGDWGTQFGKLIVAYKLWGNKEQIEKNSVQAMLELYVRFHDEAEKDPALDDSAREWFKKIEDGDSEALEIFNWFKELTLIEAKRVYDLLGVEFDSYHGESFFNDKMDRVINELKEKDLLKESDGAFVVDLEEYDMPPCLVLKSDGATLYSTRDMAAAFYRKDTYNFDKVLYVVAYQQNLHFKQWFKVMELLGYEWSKDLIHVAFGMVSMEEGTLSTRKGKVVFLEDVLSKSIEKARNIIDEKSPNLDDKDIVAKKVGVGAVVWNAVSNARIKDSVFSFDKALSFEGETAPYVQYTYARANSVLEKADVDFQDIDYSRLSDNYAMEVIRMIELFPEKIVDAANRYEPYIIARHIIDIAKAFNKFYYERRIIGEDDEVMKARLSLVKATKELFRAWTMATGYRSTRKNVDKFLCI